MKQSKFTKKVIALYMYGVKPKHISKQTGLSPRRIKKVLKDAPTCSLEDATSIILDHTLNKGRDKRYIRLPYISMILPNPKITCNDGYQVSIQCSEFTYCEPRENILDVSSYSKFELGFPNEHDVILDKYQDADVYPYTPRDVVIKLIIKHGGIKL